MRREAGAILVLLGFLLLAVSLIQSSGQAEGGFGGMIMIGPIPIIFGSNPKLAMTATAMATALMVVYLLLFSLRARRP
jgi:uncharacterized protein (TIGR00304 family)